MPESDPLNSTKGQSFLGMPVTKKTLSALQQAIVEYGRDVFLYHGDISRNGYNRLSDLVGAVSQRKEKVCLILSTNGGDAGAAYRIARALKYYYTDFDMLVPSLAKSAGTLLVIGADRVILGDRGELGPLDIQLSRPDEFLERMSGLGILQAVNSVEVGIFNAFKKYFVHLISESGMRTRMAVDIAVDLAKNCYEPIAAKVDPLTLGEHQRAINIAVAYGERLNECSKNLKGNALQRLVADYPCHDFAIDRREARGLFEKVYAPHEASEGADIKMLCQGVYKVIQELNATPSMPIVENVSLHIAEQLGRFSSEHDNDDELGDKPS